MNYLDITDSALLASMLVVTIMGAAVSNRIESITRSRRNKEGNND
jgi:hypothetical protein